MRGWALWNVQGEDGPDKTRHSEASDGVFTFIPAATVGRNLYCLDQSDTGSSSHRGGRGPRAR